MLIEFVFQFHKGSIKTLQRISSTAKGTVFQFHKGSIKTHLCANRKNHTCQFQFHKGSIKTRCRWADGSLYAFYFNSIKVRLRPSNHGVLNPLSPDFNSIKVRLRRRKPQSSRNVWILFQFHKGSIKTVIKCPLPKIELHFNSIKVRLRPIVLGQSPKTFI